MKNFRLTKGIIMILATVFVIVVGAIIVVTLSNDKAMAYYVGGDCPDRDSGCPGTLATVVSYDDTRHKFTCNECGYPVYEECSWSTANASAFTSGNNDNMHYWYARCSVCYGLKSTYYSSGVCSDTDYDGLCNTCGGATTNTGGGSGGGGNNDDDDDGSYTYDWLDIGYHQVFDEDGEYIDTEKHTSSSWADQGDGTHWALCDDCEGAARFDHTIVTVPQQNATCTSTGLTAGEYCSECNYSTGQTTIPALGHNWQNATCTAPKTCSLCGATEGNALGHDWEDATCTEAKTCNTCGTTEGTELGHDWKEATCTEPKTCNACGTTEGNPLGHNYENGICTGCGQTEPITEIEITSTKYKIEGIYIYVQPSTKVSTLKSNITTNATEIKVYGNDVEVSNDTTISTGMSLELKNGNINKIFTIIVKGDVNSDGAADFKDLVKVNKARLNKITLEEIYLRAADVNEDASLDLKDLSKINRYRLYKITEL